MVDQKAKKRIRVVGINRGRDLKAYAAKLEKAMNEMLEQGYIVEPHEEPNGVLLMCQLKNAETDRPERLSRVLGSVVVPMSALRGQAQDEEPSISDKTHALLSRFADKMGPNAAFADVVKNHVAECTRGYSVLELEAAKHEISKALEYHVKESECGGTCRNARFWTAVIAGVTQAIQQNLQ
jgi:hypothetical protein